ADVPAGGAPAAGAGVRPRPAGGAPRSGVLPNLSPPEAFVMLKLYGHFFPEQAKVETRTMTVINGEMLPDDEYGILEAYCTDPACDCRRVLLNILGRRQGALAAISFGFDRKAPDAGTLLDPPNRQGRHAP